MDPTTLPVEVAVRRTTDLQEARDWGLVLTSNKADKALVHRHSGYPGGLRTQTYGDLLSRKPEEAVRRAVRGMLPKNRLGRHMIRKLKVYAGPTHPHAAQSPTPLELAHARARS